MQMVYDQLLKHAATCIGQNAHLSLNWFPQWNQQWFCILFETPIVSVFRAITVHIIPKVKNIFLQAWCTENELY